MSSLTFVTGNTEKFAIGKAACQTHGIQLIQANLDIDEVQSEDPAYVVRHKAERAYELIGSPVVVSDDAWSTPAIKGFPGPYMKSIDYWFTPQNWLDLMRNAEDRRIILIQQLAYYDGSMYELITKEYTGYVLHEARGNYGKTLQKVVTMPGDNGLSIAEVYDTAVDHKTREVAAGWHELMKWYSDIA